MVKRIEDFEIPFRRYSVFYFNIFRHTFFCLFQSYSPISFLTFVKAQKCRTLNGFLLEYFPKWNLICFTTEAIRKHHHHLLRVQGKRVLRGALGSNQSHPSCAYQTTQTLLAQHKSRTLPPCPEQCCRAGASPLAPRCRSPLHESRAAARAAPPLLGAALNNSWKYNPVTYGCAYRNS